MGTRKLLAKTNQAWKFDLLWVGIALSALISFVPDTYFDGKANTISTVLLITTIVWCGVSIRCPRCKARWLVIAVSEKDSRIWDRWLESLENCPECEYPSYPAHTTVGTYPCSRCEQLSNSPDFCDMCGLDMRPSRSPVVMPDATESQ